MRIKPPADHGQCPTCGVPMDYVEVVDLGENRATVVADPCRHVFPIPLPA